MDLLEPGLAFWLRELFQGIQNQVRDISRGFFLISAFLFRRHNGIITFALG